MGLKYVNRNFEIIIGDFVGVYYICLYKLYLWGFSSLGFIFINNVFIL